MELYEYTIPATNNKYIIFFYAESWFNVEKPIVGSYSIVFNGNKRFVVVWGAGPYKHTPDSKLKAIRQIHAYTPHFFECYNERFLKDESLTVNQVACMYLARNPIAMPLEQNAGINRNYKQYGVYGQYAFRVRDGLCFSYTVVDGIESEDGSRNNDMVEALYICYTTYMNEQDMAESQRDAIFKEHVEKWIGYYQDFQREEKDGVITLTLEP